MEIVLLTIAMVVFFGEPLDQLIGMDEVRRAEKMQLAISESALASTVAKSVEITPNQNPNIEIVKSLGYDPCAKPDVAFRSEKLEIYIGTYDELTAKKPKTKKNENVAHTKNVEKPVATANCTKPANK